MEIKQIIVVTDGKSNTGGNPVAAAAEAARQNIIVNAIGITDGVEDEDLLDEAEEIAKAGKGTWESTGVAGLGYTMHAVTQKTVNKTIETIVGKQLRDIIGTDLGHIPPKSRSKIIEYMDRLGDEMDLRCCIVMDCSGSMANKMGTARQSIIELMNSLTGRIGKSSVAIIAYPGSLGDDYKMICDFTEDIQEVKARVLELKAGGRTPTAPAIYKAIDLMMRDPQDNEPTEWENEPMLQSNMV